MALAYVLTEDKKGITLDSSGKPMVFDDEDDKVTPYGLDALNGVAVITKLTGEATSRRKELRVVEEKLAAIPELIVTDPAAAVKALSTVAGLDDKVKADVEKVRTEVTKSFETSIADKDKAITTLTAELHEEKIGGKFGLTPILKKTLLPASIAKTAFSSFFSLEDGKVQAVGHDGNLIYSKSNPGTVAGFDEALDILIDTSPDRDSILRSKVGTGDGSHTGPETGGDTILTRSSGENIAAGLAKL